MELKILVPVIASALSGLIAIYIAILNYRSTKAIERVKGSYNLLNRDLERMEEIHYEISTLPTPSEAKIRDAFENNNNTALIAIYHELDEIYNKASRIILINKAIFDDDIFSEIEELMVPVNTSQNKDTAGIGYRMQATTGFVKCNEKQIKILRSKLTKNA